MALAQELGAAIVSVDSMQVYRGMDIGTAKPSVEDRTAIHHHLVDVVEPEEAFTVADSQRLGREALRTSTVPVIIAGGTGLAFRAIVDPLEFPGEDRVLRAELEMLDRAELQHRLAAVDPDAAAVVDTANPRRLIRALEVHAVTGLTPSQRAATPEAAAVREYRALIPFRAIGLDPGPALEDRVILRFDAMLQAGLLDEVARLAPRLGRTASQAVGYKELLPVVAGERTVAEGRDLAIAATLAVARNQRTYWRRDPRIRWLKWDDDPAVRLQRARRELEL